MPVRKVQIQRLALLGRLSVLKGGMCSHLSRVTRWRHRNIRAMSICGLTLFKREGNTTPFKVNVASRNLQSDEQMVLGQILRLNKNIQSNKPGGQHWGFRLL